MLKVDFLLIFDDFQTILQLLVFSFEFGDFTGLISLLRCRFCLFFLTEYFLSRVNIIIGFLYGAAHSCGVLGGRLWRRLLLQLWLSRGRRGR